MVGGLGLSLWSEGGLSVGERCDCGEGVRVRRWRRCAVVRIVVAGWVRSILGVGKPLVVAVCGFSKRVVRAEDVVVEPMSVRFAGCHIMDVGAVVGMIPLVRSAGLSTTAGAIAFVLKATDGGAEIGNVGCVSEGGGRLEVGE